MKKKYKKPMVCNASGPVSIIPLAAIAAAASSTALAPAVALVGGYAAGRAVKQAFDMHVDQSKNSLDGVIVV